MTSFFGGNPAMSHFTADVRYIMPRERFDSGNVEARKKAPERRNKQRAKLKALGFKTRYFQYRNDDAAAKAKAKAECEAFAKEWGAKVGFKLEVAEGCFL